MKIGPSVYIKAGQLSGNECISDGKNLEANIALHCTLFVVNVVLGRM